MDDMDDINYIKEIEKLITSLQSLKIKEKIQINELNNFFSLFENDKPIPINYYDKNLTQIKSKNKCNFCDKIAQYKCHENLYCWSCAHSFNNKKIE